MFATMVVVDLNLAKMEEHVTKTAKIPNRSSPAIAKEYILVPCVKEKFLPVKKLPRTLEALCRHMAYRPYIGLTLVLN